MNAQNLGFMSSWHMLTRDKGWIKPILVLTLVGWIPILGQIALLGYGLEWARLTAWGVDSAPKQHGVDYGKVLSSGGRAFLVNLSLGFVLALILQVVFPGSLGWMVSSLCGMGYLTATAGIITGMGAMLVMVVMSVFVGSFLHAAMLRATLYDSFGAGWRLDRLFQMIGRDFGGFCKTWLVTFIGSLISGVYAFVVTFIGGVVVLGGLLGATAFVGISGPGMGYDELAMHQLLSWGAGPVLLFVVAAIALLFVGNVISTAMALVSMNAMGQWFCRFDVNRWGVSAAPLPADVPHRGGMPGAGMGAPTSPASAAAPTAAQTGAYGAEPVQPAAQSQAATGSRAAVPADPAAPVAYTAPAAHAVSGQPVEPAAPAGSGQFVDPVASAQPAEQAGTPGVEVPGAGVPGSGTSSAGTPSAGTPSAEEPAVAQVAASGTPLERVVPLDSEEYLAPVIDEDAAREAAEVAARSIAEEQGLAGSGGVAEGTAEEESLAAGRDAVESWIMPDGQPAADDRAVPEGAGAAEERKEAQEREAEANRGPIEAETFANDAAVEPDAVKKPIPLGPITSSDGEPGEDGPVQA